MANERYMIGGEGISLLRLDSPKITFTCSVGCVKLKVVWFQNSASTGDNLIPSGERRELL
jgi:hypothetical protein